MLTIEKLALEQMTADAIRTFPDECCGFLLGREEDLQRTVSTILVVDNSREGDKRRRFEIAPRDYIQAELLADREGLQLLGVYHSHPDHPAVPSEHDRAAAQPYFSYVIVSVRSKKLDDIRSWRLNEDFQFEEEIFKNRSINQQIL
ncbi:MAG TPA: M67 family metallopeptidase [Flavisolibacter sp.]|nr:M67 family metallopeptidase [Flavisolibacter sp.]